MLGFALTICTASYAQTADSTDQSFLGFDLNKQRKLTVLPSIYFKPETNWAFGVSALMYRRFNQKDTISPLSLAGLSFSYTLNDQVLFSMPFKIFLKERILSYCTFVEYEMGVHKYQCVRKLQYRNYPENTFFVALIQKKVSTMLENLL